MSKNIVKITVFVSIIILAVLFMLLGAQEEGRKYSIEEVKDLKYFILQKDGKYGVIDKKAQVIIENKYENIIIPNPSKALFVCVTENNQNKILNEKQEELFTEYEEVSCIKIKNSSSNFPYEKSVLKYKSKGKYGLIDYNGSKVTEAIYDRIDSLGYKEGALVVEQEGKYGVINIKGIKLVSIEYDIIKSDEYDIDNNYENSGYIVGIKTKEGYRYGYLDIDGQKILDLQFNEINRVSDVYIIASKNGQYGVYKNKELIINNNYQSINYDKNNNIFILEKNKKFGVADSNGQIIIDIKYAQIDLSGKYLYVKDTNEKTEVYEVTGKLTNMSPNESKQNVANGKYIIKIVNNENKTLYGIEDNQEKELVKAQYNYIEYLFDNYFMVSNEEGKLGIIDSQGEIKLDIKYNLIQKIKNTNLLQTLLDEDDVTQIYSEKLEKIYEMPNAVITPIDDFVKIYNDKEKKYISNYGKIVNNKDVYKNNIYFAVVKDGKWGFEDEKGNIVIECNYDKVTEFNEYGYAGIMKDGKWGVVDNNLKIILEPKYEFLNKEVEPFFLGSYYKIDYGQGEIIYTNISE